MTSPGIRKAKYSILCELIKIIFIIENDQPVQIVYPKSKLFNFKAGERI